MNSFLEQVVVREYSVAESGEHAVFTEKSDFSNVWAKTVPAVSVCTYGELNLDKWSATKIRARFLEVLASI